MNVLHVISEELAVKVVSLAVAKERTPVLRAVSQLLARDEPPTKVAWQQVPPLVLRASVLRAGFADVPLAQLLAGAWLRHSSALRQTVWQALQAQGYAAPGPAPDQVVEAPQRLRPADLLSVPIADDPGRSQHYFRPAGQPLLNGQQDEAVTLMAHLLGWSVLSSKTAPGEAAPEPAEAPPASESPALPGDDEPEVVALEASFGELSAAEIEAIPPRESALLVARSRQRLRHRLLTVVEQHHAGTMPPPQGELGEEVVNTIPNLASYATDLADALAGTAEALRRGELPPTLAAEVQELSLIHLLFDALYIRIAGHLGPVVLPAPEGRTVAALHDLAATVREAGNSTAARASAMGHLARLLRLRHRTLPDFAPLAEVQAQAQALTAELTAAPDAELPAAARTLHSGAHPWVLLLRLAGDAEALEQLDDQAEAFQALEAALPRALVTALLLRKLELRPDPDDALPIQSVAHETDAPAIVPVLETAPVSRAVAAEGRPGETGAGADDTLAAGLPAMQWQLLAESRLALAWHLTRATQPAAGLLPARLLHALLLAPALHRATGAIAQALAADFLPSLTEQSGPENQLPPLATRLLEMAAALRPALLAPATGAAAWLADALPKLPALNALLQLISSREAPAPLQPELGFSPPTQAAWQARMEALREALNTWETAAQAARYGGQKMHAATRFWHQLLAADQPGGQLLGHLCARGPATPLRAAVLATMEQLQNPARVEALLLEYGQFLPAGHPARLWLRERLDELIDLAGQWLNLRAIQPGRGALSHLEAQEKAFCQKLATALPPAQQELAALLPEADEPLRTALPWASAALAWLHALLHQPDPAGPEPTVVALTDGPLLIYDALPVAADAWLPAPTAPLPALREAAAQPEPAWAESFAAHLGRGQHQATTRLLTWPAAAHHPDLVLLRQQHAEALEGHKQALDARVGQIRKAVELAVRRGWLSASQRTDFLLQHSRLLHLGWQRATTDEWALDFGVLNHELDQTEDVLRAAEAAGGGTFTPGFGPANRAFAQFFPDQLRLLEQELESHPLPELLGRLTAGGTIAGTGLAATSPDARAAASQALYAWEELRGERTARSSQALADVAQLLAFLGFGNPQVSRPAVPLFNGPEVADLSTGTVADAQRCPVSYYGSAAGGSYRLVFVWGKATAEQLLEEARKGTEDGPDARPVLLFYFNSLSETQRHDLAAHSRQRRQTLLVLDRALLVYLATAGLLYPDRLPLFFQLALPFAWLEPYPSQAPELFVGRHTELEALQQASLNSPGLLLGEPRTGKTALFARLVARHHWPELGQLVLVVDLAQLGPPERLLAAFEREMKRLLAAHGLVPAGMVATLSFPKLLRYVRTWLQAQPNRRVLLLLDNVAEFLVRDDALNLRYVTPLMDLALDTDARFKPVMACAKWPLSTAPFEPVHLGPLLGPADAGAAEALLRRPLESLGVVFDDEADVSWVLAEAGYFPHLVQAVGQRLLAYLYAQPLPAAGERPAYRLGREDVRAVLRAAEVDICAASQALVAEAPDHYLAFLLLSSPDAQEQFGGAPGGGLLPAELFAAACHYWPQGSIGPQAWTATATQALLNRMTVVGMAHRAATGRYFLAEPFWRRMGSADEMRTELESFATGRAGASIATGPAGPVPTPKISMLKRLTNGRRRL